MKRVINSICATGLIVAGTLGMSSMANAVAISYEGMLSVPFGAVSGSVSGSGWANDIAAETDFWSFQVGAGGAALDIWALRGNEALDTAFTVYGGGITTAEEVAARVAIVRAAEFPAVAECRAKTRVFRSR